MFVCCTVVRDAHWAAWTAAESAQHSAEASSWVWASILRLWGAESLLSAHWCLSAEANSASFTLSQPAWTWVGCHAVISTKHAENNNYSTGSNIRLAYIFLIFVSCVEGCVWLACVCAKKSVFETKQNITKIYKIFLSVGKCPHFCIFWYFCCKVNSLYSCTSCMSCIVVSNFV